MSIPSELSIQDPATVDTDVVDTDPIDPATIDTDPKAPAVSGHSEDPSVLKTWVGAAIAGSIGYFAYRLMIVMVSHFPAINPEASRLARSISLLVRYFVVGTVALMAFMFGAVAVGLLAYSGQQLVQKVTKRS